MQQPNTPNRRPLPLGNLLQSAGLVTHEHIEQAVRTQVETGEPLGITLVRMGVLKARDGVVALAVHEEICNSLEWCAVGGTPAHDRPLPVCLKVGEMLLARGEVLRQELEKALQLQSKNMQRLGDLLLRVSSLSVEQLADALSLQQRLHTAVLLMGLGFAVTLTPPAAEPVAAEIAIAVRHAPELAPAHTASR